MDNPKKYRLLVVDDDPNMIKLIQFYLIKDAYQIIACYSGEEALKILKTETFDAILIDILMPQMDGFTLLEKMKDDLSIDSPIIVVTAHGASDKLMQLMDAGAHDILQKPFTTNRLKLTLRNALSFKELQEKCKRLEKILLKGQ